VIPIAFPRIVVAHHCSRRVMNERNARLEHARVFELESIENEKGKKRDESCEKMTAIIDDPVASHRIVFPVDPLPRTIIRYQSDDNTRLEY